MRHLIEEEPLSKPDFKAELCIEIIELKMDIKALVVFKNSLCKTPTVDREDGWDDAMKYTEGAISEYQEKLRINYDMLDKLPSTSSLPQRNNAGSKPDGSISDSPW